MILYLIRHGEVYNPKQISYGRLPGFKLSKNGQEQALKTAQSLKDKNIAALFTSPMLRARQTAKIVGSILKVKPKTDKRLIEVKNGLQGISLVEFRKQEQSMYQNISKTTIWESIETIETRMCSFAEMVKRKYSGQSVAAVTHGDPILIFKAWYERVPFTYEYKYRNMLRVGQVLEIDLSTVVI